MTALGVTAVALWAAAGHHVIAGYRVDIAPSVVLLSLGGAGCYAVASALQHLAAAQEPDEAAVRPSLLFRLVQRPVWLFGNVADGAGYLCQFLALRRGSQALVQPLLLTGLIFALPVGALLEHHPVTRRDVLGAMVVVLGVGGFVVISRPGAGNPHASLWQWTVLTVLVAAVVGAATLAARDGSQRRRGILLALGAGVLYGYTSAVGEYTARLLDRGVLAVVTSWAPYVLIAAGVIGMLLAQSAFQAGNLRFSLPTLTVAEPLVAIAIGQVLFGEHIASNGLAPALEVLALALMVAGVFLVVRQEETADAR